MSDTSGQLKSGSLRILDIQWRRGPDLPRPVKGQAQGVIDGKIVYACGFAFDKDGYERPAATATRDEVNQARSPRRLRYCHETWQFDPATNEFMRLLDAPVGAFWPEGAASGDDFYLLTGAMREASVSKFNDCWQEDEKRDLTSARIFRMRRFADGWQWSELPSMHFGRFLPGVAVVDYKLYVIGGQSSFGGAPCSGDTAGPQINAVEVLDLANPDAGWTDVAPIPGMARECASVAVAGGRLYAFGGFYHHLYHDPTRHVKYCGDAYFYDPQTLRWEQLPDLPFGIEGTAAATITDRYILLMNGLNGGNRVEHQFSGDRSGPNRTNLQTIVFDTHDKSYRILPTEFPRAPIDLVQPRNPPDDPTSQLTGYWIWQKPAVISETTVYLLGGEVLDLAYSNCSDAMWIGTLKLG